MFAFIVGNNEGLRLFPIIKREWSRIGQLLNVIEVNILVAQGKKSFVATHTQKPIINE